MKLNREQQKLAENGAMGHALIRGIAGSGKTTVGVRRIFYLLEKYCMGEDEVLFLTYNRSLCKYVEYIYQQIDAEKPLTLFDMQEDKEAKQPVDVRTIDALALRYFKMAIKNKELTICWSIPDAIFQDAIYEVQKSYPKCKLITKQQRKFLLDEIAWMKGCHYHTLESYQEAERMGRCNTASGEDTRKLFKHSTNREAIFKLMETIDQLLLRINQIDMLSANQIALDYVCKHRPSKLYKHIIIDEAQDLTKVQLDFIAALKEEGEDSSILFLMDVAQSIYPHAWLVKGRTFKSIGYDMTGKGYKLSKNYRTTTEISQCAYSLLAQDLSLVQDENFVKPSLIERHGDYPIYRHFSDSKEQSAYVIRLIKALNKTYDLKDMAIVCKFNKSLEILHNQLAEQHIASLLFKGSSKEVDFSRDEIKLLTMHSIKGLEFKVVLLIDLNKNVIPYYQAGISEEEQKEDEWMERKLLYVGMTRAQEKLFMFSYGEASKFIGQIDKRFLSMQMDAKMNAFYQLPYENYLFREKLADQYQEEEGVRQWLIHELIHTYGYPKALIDIEYTVRSFSQRGKVDVVVKNGKTQEAYILVETKNKQVPIEDAIDQLKSYMHVCGATYGIATNGKNIAFLDQNFARVKDIPVCNHSILPSSIEYYKYVDKRTYQEYVFARDVNVREIIMEESVIKEAELQKLPIYSDIAAGVPIEIVDDEKGKFYLPQEWTKQKVGLYMLQVRGESMIGAGIDDGDYVVVDGEQSVNPQDIGVVYYNGATTLKRVVPMGDTILLMSENPDYEPIHISEGDFQLQGKLVGVVKKL